MCFVAIVGIVTWLLSTWFRSSTSLWSPESRAEQALALKIWNSRTPCWWDCLNKVLPTNPSLNGVTPRTSNAEPPHQALYGWWHPNPRHRTVRDLAACRMPSPSWGLTGCLSKIDQGLNQERNCNNLDEAIGKLLRYLLAWFFESVQASERLRSQLIYHRCFFELLNLGLRAEIIGDSGKSSFPHNLWPTPIVWLKTCIRSVWLFNPHVIGSQVGVLC